MHLLNVHTRKLERFGDSNVPMYAILSHTWENVEITHQDIQSPDVDRRLEYEKVKKTCELAAAHGLDYVWIDTCCIDKTSSAELSEAINSMFMWYREAAICFAYLCDVRLDNSDPGRLRDWNSDFSTSRWFSRGWTLQELIAPRIVVFLNQYWQQVGTKATLKEAVSSITRIPIDVLLGQDLQSLSVAQKMSWASRRETSRAEDRAYSLLGIFGVNMPLLYGEGLRSFIRLQEEIIRVTDDYSIFAWKSSEAGGSGLLARTPDVFYHSHDVVSDDSSLTSDEPIVFNSKGIHLSAQILEGSDLYPVDFAVLPCKLQKRNGRLAIHLQSVPGSTDRFERVNNERFELINAEEIGGVRPKRVCIKVGAEVQKKWRPLSKAAAHGNKRLVRYMLEQGADPDDSQYNGQSSLANAILNRHEDIVKLLLKYGPQANSTLLGTETSLALAFATGHKAIIRMLLEDGVLSTPLALTFTHGVEAIKKMLLECGIRVVHTDQELIIKTAAKDTRNAMRILLKHGGDPIAYHSFRSAVLPKADTPGRVSRISSQAGTDTGHHGWAAQPRHSERLRVKNTNFVSLIWEDGADLESKDSDEWTALTWAVAQGYETFCRVLVDSGVDLESRDRLGVTPLTWAARNEHETIIKILLEKGAKADCVGTPEGTPLGWACRQGNKTIVQMLLSEGANPDRQDRAGNTPLHHAVGGGNDAVVKVLLEKGASPDLRDREGYTALYSAVSQSRELITTILLKAGASPNSQSKYGGRPLGAAIYKGRTELAKLLIEAGADPHYYGDRGLTPLMVAALEGHEDIVKLLLEHGVNSTIEAPDGRTALNMTGNEKVRQLLRVDTARRKRKRSEDENYKGEKNSFRKQSGDQMTR